MTNTTQKIKKLFNTGVQYCNHCDKEGNLIVLPFEQWINGQLHKVYYLESEVPEGYKKDADYLCSGDFALLPHEIKIKIVDGGMLSEYAVFSKS